jgi:pyruvate dehydrogenase E1 component alpha subunit
MDVELVADAARRAADTVRAGAGPCFLELRTYRFRAHSLYDPDRYRDKAEIERWKERDPITQLAARMRADGQLDDTVLAEIDADVAAELDRAVAAAEEAPLEPVEDLTRHVYADRG